MIQSYKDSSIATWFRIRDNLGQVARSPISRQWSMYSVVGLLRILGKFVYDMEGKMVMSPEYRWLNTDLAFVTTLGKTPISASISRRCNASPLAKFAIFCTQLGPEDDSFASALTASSSLTKNGTT